MVRTLQRLLSRIQADWELVVTLQVPQTTVMMMRMQGKVLEEVEEEEAEEVEEAVALNGIQMIQEAIRNQMAEYIPRGGGHG
jgi:adenylate kinase family enzyme